jgi:hypothetical protein
VAILLGKLLNALAGAVGTGALFYTAIGRGLDWFRCTLLLPVYLLFTANLLAALPEHFGLSTGLLAVCWAVYASGMTPRRKVVWLAGLSVAAGGVTLTNFLFPAVCLAWVWWTHRGEPWARSAWLVWPLRLGVLAVLLAFGLAVTLVMHGIMTRRPLLFADSMRYLNWRLFRDPAGAVEYSLAGLVFPAIGPVPHVTTAPQGQDLPMVSYEPITFSAYTPATTVALTAWLLLLSACAAAAVHQPARRSLALPLFAWLAFNLLFHNVWADEFFLFSTHWSWALMALVLTGATGIPRWLVLGLVLAIVPGQIVALLSIRASLLPLL